MRFKIITFLVFLLFLISYIQSPYFDQFYLDDRLALATLPLFFIALPISYFAMKLYSINCGFAPGSFDVIECYGLDPKIGYVLVSLVFSVLIYYLLVKFSERLNRH